MDAVLKLRAFFTALEGCHGDPSALKAVFVRHLSARTIAHSAGQAGRDLIGAEALLGLLMHFFSAFSDLRFSETHASVGVEGKEDIGTVLVLMTCRQTGTLMGIVPATGKTLSLPLFVSAKLDTGDDSALFSELWLSMDTRLIVEQLQLLEWAKILFPQLATIMAGFNKGASGSSSASTAASAGLASPSKPAAAPQPQPQPQPQHAAHSSTASDMSESDGSDWFNKG